MFYFLFINTMGTIMVTDDKVLADMRQLVQSKQATLLTLDNVSSLVGKRIRTIYFGYNGQDGVKDFTVGGSISHWDLAATDTTAEGYDNRQLYWLSYMDNEQIHEEQNIFVVLDITNTPTYIRSYKDGSFFWCSDEDRPVYYILL